MVITESEEVIIRLLSCSPKHDLGISISIMNPSSFSSTCNAHSSHLHHHPHENWVVQPPDPITCLCVLCESQQTVHMLLEINWVEADFRERALVWLC